MFEVLSFLESDSSPTKLKYIKNIQLQVSIKLFSKMTVFSDNIFCLEDVMEVGDQQYIEEDFNDKLLFRISYYKSRTYCLQIFF